MTTAAENEIESRFVRLMLTSLLKATDAAHPEIDMAETVRQHMLGICGGVRQRAIDSAGEGRDSSQAAAHVDKLIAMIEESFAYAALPQFGEIRLVKAE